MKNQQECPVCNSHKIHSFHEQKNVPVYCNVPWPDKEEALAAPKGTIKLVLCLQCGHVYNSCFDPSLLAYTPAYENSLHFSKIFQEYADKCAVQLVDRFQLYNKDLVENGCGKGDFLALLCSLGNNRGTGFDKSYNNQQGESSQLRFINDYYSSHYADIKADFFYCRHVLEHIVRPQSFLDEIKQGLVLKSSVDIFFEVPNLLYILKSMGIWDIIYEHCGYFSFSSLEYLFSQHGFFVEEISESFQTQFLTLYGTLKNTIGHQRTLRSVINGQRKTQFCVTGHLNALKRLASVFSDNYRGKIEKWQKVLKELKPGKAVIWGAGSKGVTFLNTLDTIDKILWAVDINPRKQQKYIPGTGQPVVAPTELKHIKPEVVFVMNPNYRNEIKTQLDSLELACELICV